jgi:hypothetical protein
VSAQYDEYAEAALIGAAIMWPGRCGEAFLSVGPDDWYRPANAGLAGVVSKMLRSGQAIDAVSVFGQVQAQGLSRDWDGVKVFSLTELAINPESAVEHAKRLRALSGRRKLLEACQRASQRLESVRMDEEDGDVRALTAELRHFCDEAEATTTDRTMPVPTGMDDFLAVETTRNWLVPGLLERMDRTVITGAEGGGKSVLCSQIAATLAGGVHPFGGQVLGDGAHGVRVLVIDCENSADQSRRRYSMIIQRVNDLRDRAGIEPVNWNEQMAIDTRPAGIDLLSPRDVAWLEHSVSACAPDLLVLGPLYKLHHRDPSDEPSAREVAWVLDGLRERHGFALLTEAHAGKGKEMDTGKRLMAPIGSSMWLRWPEFGFGLRRADTDPGRGRAEVVDVVPWRGAREERAWPSRLNMAHTLPWIPDGEYFDTMNDYHEE